MNDKKYLYTKVQKSLESIYGELSGYELHRVNVLSGMISGLLHSRNLQLPAMAKGLGEWQVNLPSRVMQFKRWLLNKHTGHEAHYMPMVPSILKSLSAVGELVISIDGSNAGRGCAVLMVSVVYKQRALPLVWFVKEGSKGHFKENDHISLARALSKVLEGYTGRVVFLGDGEFDGCDLQKVIEGFGWEYALRTAKDTLIYPLEGESFAMGDLDTGDYGASVVENVAFTNKKYKYVHVVWCHEKGFEDSLFLVTNISPPLMAIRYYKKRFKIETFFSDQKTKGFQLHRSRISEPERLQKLLIVACLAYVFMVFLGVRAESSPHREKLHRQDRCDLSLFSLGELFLNFLIDNRMELCLEQVPVIQKSKLLL